MSQPTVLLISPYFPPSTLAGVHRARHLSKYLPDAGWHPVVLCVDERDHVQTLDPELARLLRTDIEMVKVHGVPAWLARGAGIGDISLRAWSTLKIALYQLLERQPIDAVLITGSPFYPMLFARSIQRRFQLPVVLDFQDPWVSAWGATQPLLSKARLANRLAVSLEPRALRSANFITSVSEVQNAEMLARYPWLRAERMAAIPIGGDADDFVKLREYGFETTAPDLQPGCIHLSYVGTCLPRSTELLSVLFRAFARLRAAEPELAEKIQLNFVGTSNQPDDTTTYRVRPIAEAEGVGSAVNEIPQRLPYLQALGCLARSHGLLLVGSDEPHYTASKIYPALMSGTPYLSLFHRMSSAHTLLSSAGGGQTFAFDGPEQLAALEDRLAEGLRILATDPKALGTADPETYTAYTAKAVAAQFGGIFDQLTKRPLPDEDAGAFS